MRNPSVATAALIAAVMVGMAACSSASSDWTKASTTNTIAGYQQFINDHPSDPHANEAKALIAQRQDSAAWSDALQAKNLAGYQGYLDKFPQGSNQSTARLAITDLNRANDWKTAQAGSADEVKAFLNKYSTGPEVEQAKDKLKTLTGYHARFATETSVARAEKRMSEMQKRLGQKVSDLQIVTSADNKTFYVDSGGMTEDDAKALCQSVKKSVSRCESVQE